MEDQKKCFLFDRCNHKDCDSEFCLRKYKLETLYNESLLSEKQRQHTVLYLDADKRDLAAFQQLSEKEKNIVDVAASGENILIYSSQCGNGKAQPDAAKIFCDTGYVQMKDIQVGQKLFGEDGNLHTVIGKFDRGMKDVYRVEFQDGSSTECCDEHLWTVYDHKDKTTKTITLSEMMANGIKYHYTKTRTGSKRYEIPVTTPLKFADTAVNFIDPYVLGFILGDGHISKKSSITVAVGNDDAEESINRLNNPLPNGYCCAKAANNAYSLKLADHNGIKKTFGSFRNKVKEYLSALGLAETTAYTKFIPDCYKYTAIEDRISLLQGLMDTDGTVSKQAKGGCQLSYSTASKQLANDFAFIIESLGGTCSIRERKGKSYTYKNEKRFGHAWYNCTIKLPIDIEPFRLERKLTIYNELKGHYQKAPYRMIENVTHLGKKHCYCIMTDNPTHLYLTDDLVVTHNTSWAIRLMESYFDKIWVKSDLTCRGLFIDVPTFLLNLKSSISNKNDMVEHIKQYILTADIVIWDDIANKTGTEFELTQLLSFINQRINLGKTNIYTSNHGRAEMYNLLGERLTSRIYNNSTVFELCGADKRGLKIGGNN